MERIERLKLINALTGIKSANLIGSINKDGITNVAIFSSVVHLGSDPALIGFISRPRTKEVGHTYSNIIENGSYTINHVHSEFVKNAHYTSAKFDAQLSEFDRCNLSEEFIRGIKAPFVKESTFKMALTFKEAIDIPLNGTVLMIGEIERIILPATAITADDINLEAAKSVGISGINTYYKVEKLARFPYAKVAEIPTF